MAYLPILTTQGYHARLHQFERLEMPDGKSVFKLYFLSIIGRAQPEKYEWAYTPYTSAEFIRTFRTSGQQGLGFVITFPHVTKIYRFYADKETVLDVSEHHTADLRARDLSRGDGFHEFGCLAEAALAAEEYQAWASAHSVEEYLAFKASACDFPVVDAQKLYRYWQS
jgi:hypothetical protein